MSVHIVVSRRRCKLIYKIYKLNYKTNIFQNKIVCRHNWQSHIGTCIAYEL